MRNFDWTAPTQAHRMTGRTTAMAEAARKIKATLVVRNRRECERVEFEHGIRCVTLFERDRVMGAGPVLFDPDAVGLICDQYEKLIYDMGRDLAGTKLDLANALVALARKPRRRKVKR